MANEINDFEKVEEKINLTDILKYYNIDLSKNPTNCPFHTSKKKHSFSYNNHTFHCFDPDCNNEGNLFHFIMKKESCSLYEALIKAAEIAGIELNHIKKSEDEIKEITLQREKEQRRINVLTEAAELFNTKLSQTLRKKIKKARAWTDETIDEFKIGYSIKGIKAKLIKKGFKEEDIIGGLVSEKNYEYFQKRIMFPYIKNSKVCYFIGRQTKATPKDKYNEAKYIKLKSDYLINPIFNTDNVNKTQELFITEGVADCISIHQAGYSCISPVTIRFKKADYPRLLKYAKDKKVFIANDNEERGSGEEGAVDSAKYLFKNGIANIKVIQIPKAEDIEKIDMCDYLKDNEISDLIQNHSKHIIDFMIDRIQDEHDFQKIQEVLELMSYNTLIPLDSFLKAFSAKTKISIVNATKKINIILKEREKQNKKEKLLEEEKGKPKHKIGEASEFFIRLKQAEKFIEKQPLFYDNAGLWWMWDFEAYCYKMVDEVDILNGISKEINIDTTASRTKTEILNALKQVGRRNIPKEAIKSWIQFKDKIVDVKTGEQFKVTPKYFITNPIPWEIGESEDTPTIDRLFKEWVVMTGVQDSSYVDTLYEITAYSGLQNQFLQRLFALTGTGSNGKGCFLKLIKKYLGEDNICTSELKLLSNNNFESSGLYKKQACMIGEVDAYDMQNTNLLKKLTGEDDIRYEFKGKTQFSEKSGTTCFMATNSLPVTPDQSFGFYRRWLIIDFPHVFSVGKDVIGEILEIEFNNLAKKCIRICKELYKKEKFTNEGNAEERAKRYEERSNPLLKFIEDECEENAEEYAIFKDFYKRFCKYLKKNRLRLITKIAVSRALKKEGFQVKGRRTLKENGDELHTTCVFSIKLKEES